MTASRMIACLWPSIAYASIAFANQNASLIAQNSEPQFPKMLEGYAIRPPWKVAGVDYYVGVPPGIALKTPTTISMTGVSVDSLTHVVTISTSNVTLNGYDFSADGGWQIAVTNKARNVTIRNSFFKVGANRQNPVMAEYAGSINVLSNTFDGGASSGNYTNSMVYSGASSALIQSNRFTNFADDAIDIAKSASNIVIEYNLFDTMNVGEYHTDCIQTYDTSGSGQNISGLVIQYNTMYQPPQWSGRMNAFSRIGDQGKGIIKGPVAAFNTIVVPAGAGNSASGFQWGIGDPGTLTNPSIHDNYFDGTGILYANISVYLHKGVVNPTTYDNFSLTNGKRVLLGPYESKTSGVPANPPAAPTINAAAIVNTNQMKLTGSAPPRTSINLHDHDILLGTVAANNSGAWSFTTNQLLTGDHSFTATATDAYANTSPASPVSAVSLTNTQTDR
jgi:hypothetical protein